MSDEIEAEAKALRVTRDLGISDEDVKPVLRKLLETYDNNWTFISEGNYKTLVDAYFEDMDDKEQPVFENKKSRGLEGHGGSSGRPLKRLQSGGKETHNSPVKIDSSEDSDSLELSYRQPTNGRSGSRSVVRHSHASVKLERSASFDASSSRDRKSASSREAPTVFREKTMDEPSSSTLSRGNGPHKLHREGFLRPGSERQVDNFPPSRKPIQVNRHDSNGRSSSSSGNRNPQPVVGQKRPLNGIADITKGTEKVKISLVLDSNCGDENLPKFNYIPQNIIYQHGNINISMARIADEACCSSCTGNCLSSIPCACARETGGEFAYTPDGLLKEKFLRECMAMKEQPQENHFFYCKDCPLEKSKNEYTPGKCKGHLIRKFIKECWRKCGCHMLCGNRIVQRGISRKLQVFLTSQGKGWGLRSLERLPKGTFVCEYVGEVLTNTEMYERNLWVSNERHTYPVTLDADWGSERILVDEEALCLDATFHGNVARFINHRCSDGNLVDIPVEVETPDHHYYHLAFFTSRDVAALEELTWDYGIDFEDTTHPIEAFRCCCGSAKCRGNRYGYVDRPHDKNS